MEGVQQASENDKNATGSSSEWLSLMSQSLQTVEFVLLSHSLQVEATN